MSSKPQSGNVLILILIAVALFAALSVVVTQTGRTGVANTDREKISLELNRIHAFSISIKTAISRLMTDGVTPAQFNFDNDGFTVDYSNPNCTTPRCVIFSGQGGGANWDTPPFVISPSNYIITGYNQVKGVGTDAPGDSSASELIVIAPDISQQTCKIINQMLGAQPSDPIPTDTTGCLVETGGTDFYYKGTFGAGNVIEDTGNPTALENKFEACVRCTGTPDKFYYYSVILAR